MTGVITFIFVVWHVFETRVQVASATWSMAIWAS